MEYREVDIDTAKGNIDDFALMEKGKPDTAVVLLGWDEVGLFDGGFENPIYVRILGEEA